MMLVKDVVEPMATVTSLDEFRRRKQARAASDSTTSDTLAIESFAVDEHRTDGGAILATIAHGITGDLVQIPLVGPDMDGTFHSGQDGIITAEEIVASEPLVSITSDRLAPLVLESLIAEANHVMRSPYAFELLTRREAAEWLLELVEAYQLRHRK